MGAILRFFQWTSEITASSALDRFVQLDLDVTFAIAPLCFLYPRIRIRALFVASSPPIYYFLVESASLELGLGLGLGSGIGIQRFLSYSIHMRDASSNIGSNTSTHMEDI